MCILWMAGEVIGDEETADICKLYIMWILLFHYLKRYCTSWPVNRVQIRNHHRF